MPRARKLTPELKARILGFVRAGNEPLTAARACGVGETTWYRWLRTGRAGEDEEYAALADEVEEAQSVCKASLVALLRQAAMTDWRAAAVMLERLYPDEWGRRSQMDHRHEVVAPSAYQLLPPEKLARVKRLAARAGEGEEEPTDRPGRPGAVRG